MMVTCEWLKDDFKKALISKCINEPSHEIMVLFILRKLIFQTCMHSHPAGLDVWFLVRPFVYFHTSCVRSVKALARLRRLAWVFAGRLCDKCHNLMSWLKCPLGLHHISIRQRIFLLTTENLSAIQEATCICLINLLCYVRCTTLQR